MIPKKLTQEEFKRLKDRLYRASNALTLCLENVPELKHFSLRLNDGHELSLAEVISWIQAARSDCWKFGPTEVRLRRFNQMMNQQPRG